MTEPLLVLRIHLSKIRHVRQENPRPNYFLNPTSRLVEDRLDVLAALPCDLCDRAVDELTVFVGGDLTGDPDLAGGFDGLGVRAGSCEGVLVDVRGKRAVGVRGAAFLVRIFSIDMVGFVDEKVRIGGGFVVMLEMSFG